MALIDEFIATVRDTDPSDDAAFKTVIEQAVTLLDLSDKEIAHQFGVSYSTLERWKSGKTAPHPAMRGVVFHFLASFAEGRVPCVECGHEEHFHSEDDGWSTCSHGVYKNEEGMTCYPCNCGNNIGR